MAFEDEDVAELKARLLEVLDRVGKISVAADELGIGHALGRSWAREAGFEPVRGRRRHPRRGEYEQLRAQGVPQRRAAEQTGVNQRTARDWDAERVPAADHHHAARSGVEDPAAAGQHVHAAARP